MRQFTPHLVAVATLAMGLPLIAAAQNAQPPRAEIAAEAAIAAALTLAVRPETAERIAVFKKNLYDALLSRGFTQQQAITIVVATPVPGLPQP